MKNALILMLAFCISSFSIAQNGFESLNVKTSQVPKAVKDAQDNFYPTGKVTQWKEHTWSDNYGNEYVQYIAWFNVAGFKGKAYYGPDGTGKHSVVYFNGYDLPESMQEGIAMRYPDYKLRTAEKVRLLNKNLYAYNIHLKNGKEKLNVWVDLQGRQVESSRLVSSLSEAYQSTALAR